MEIEKVFQKFPCMETCRLNLTEIKEDYDENLFEFFSDSKVMEYAPYPL